MTFELHKFSTNEVHVSAVNAENITAVQQTREIWYYMFVIFFYINRLVNAFFI